ncbi:hypothetical protein AVEN_103361-1 [Araneus ventricosus]|uniref:Uncharacterized protein n=1 Tax=Araneus ventricosus TaxID=182803 RepID=A0A4Y2P258_ARAVE|nr:hypothetical protein AVEN_103361-1 [Araneus ventricosus]
MLLAFSLSRSRSAGNGKGTPINTWANSVREELHLFSVLHGRIKFYIPPHGKIRDENAKVREAATDATCMTKKTFKHSTGKTVRPRATKFGT